MDKNLKNKLALDYLKNLGIDIPLKHQKYIIAYPYQDDMFPVFVGDDGGYDFFECELPLCRNGDPIKIGIRYDTSNLDNCLVLGMKLNGYFSSRWIITAYAPELDREEELLGYEFLNIAF